MQRDVSTAPEHFYAELAYTPRSARHRSDRCRGGRPGDILLVEVLDIRVAPRAWTMAMKDRGVLGSRIETGESRVLPIDGQTLAFGRRCDSRYGP